MATNHTENYNLNLWEPTDKFVREEFNENTSKIDEAFLNHPSAELIASVAVEEENQDLVLDISEVDWSRYMALVLIADSAEYNGFYVYMGDQPKCTSLLSPGSHASWNNSLTDLANASHMTAVIPVFYSGSHSVSVLSSGIGYYDVVTNADTVAGFACGASLSPLDQCETITIKCSGGYTVGDHAVLWGVK